MADINVVAIQKMDVLMENFSYVKGLMETVAADSTELLEAKNTWEVIFPEYDDDPREIPDIPEVVNWIRKSVEEGIPWFYFIRCESDAIFLRILLIVCCSDKDTDAPGHYNLEKDRVLEFVNRNFLNLNLFVDRYGISDEINRKISDDVMNYIIGILSGDSDSASNNEKLNREKQVREALERLEALENYYGLNPKVRRYFEEGKLYYSYLTGGGCIGSIDTIHYNQDYADIVQAFEEQTSCLVYHVIEHRDTLSLLFVSDDYSCWQDERPQRVGVPALVVDLDNGENKYGYIKLDVLQGALRRRDSKVYSELPGKTENDCEFTELSSEVVERLEILKTNGLLTDLNLADIYMFEDEICFSELHSLFGTDVCIVNRISANPHYQAYVKALSRQIPHTLYFMMVTEDKKLAFLYVSDDEDSWAMEKRALEQERPYAIVLDMEEGTAVIRQIRYRMVNGGPLCLL